MRKLKIRIPHLSPCTLNLLPLQTLKFGLKLLCYLGIVQIVFFVILQCEIYIHCSCNGKMELIKLK